MQQSDKEKKNQNLKYFAITFFAIALFTTLSSFLTQYFLPHECHASFVKFYKNNLRSELFGGFLSIAGLVFALKAFIILTLYKELYSDQKYIDFVNELNNINNNINRLKPLNNLRILLTLTIGLSLAAAFAQLTFGFIPAVWSSALAISISVLAMAALIASFIIQWISIRDLVNFWMGN